MHPAPHFLVRFMMLSLALLICLSAASGARLKKEAGRPGGTKADAAFVLDMDAGEGEAKVQPPLFPAPVPGLFLAAPPPAPPGPARSRRGGQCPQKALPAFPPA